MANVLFIKTLLNLLKDTPFKKDIIHPFQTMAIKHGLKALAKGAATNEIRLEKSELFIRLCGDEMVCRLLALREECTTHSDNPFSYFCDNQFSLSLDNEVSGKNTLKLIYVSDIDKAIEICNKYRNDYYFIPSFIAGVTRSSPAFFDRIEIFGFVEALEQLEGLTSRWRGMPSRILTTATLSSLLEVRREIDTMMRDYILGTVTYDATTGLAGAPYLRDTLLEFLQKLKKWEAKTGKGIRLDSSDRKLLAASESKEYKLYELKTLKALQQETNEIGHCVGRSDTYFKKIENDLSLIFSLKHLNKAVATLEYSPATYNLIQCKGHKNDPVPEEHLTALIPLLNSAAIYINKVFESKVTEEFKNKLHSFVGPMLVATESKMFSHADLLAGHRLHTDLHAPNVNVRTLEVEYQQRHAWGRQGVLTTEVRLTVELSQAETNNIRELQNRWDALGRDRIVDAGVRLVGAITTEAPYEAVYPSVELTFSVTVEEFQAVAGAFEVNSFLRVASTLVGLSLRSPIVGRLTENEARHAV